jgi:hypothetical protein
MSGPTIRSRAGHALAGQALIGLGRRAEAKEELEAARRELETVPRVALGLIPRRMQVEPWVDGVRGEVLLREGNREEGGAVIREVIRAMRAIPGPDAWTLALFRIESMARTAREVGDWELAAFIAGQMLEHDPDYGGSTERKLCCATSDAAAPRGRATLLGPLAGCRSRSARAKDLTHPDGAMRSPPIHRVKQDPRCRRGAP